MTLPTERRAFTLVEILMVLAILGIVTVISMPYLVKSIRGNRLRVAGATVVKAGRYARNMALLHTQDMKLILDISAATVRVEPRYEAPAPSSRTPTASAPEPVPPPLPMEAGSGGAVSPPVSASPSVAIARKLDDVRIDYVELEHHDRENAGTVTVIYRTNGRCTPYEVRIVDEYDHAMIITVDALSSPETRREEP